MAPPEQPEANILETLQSLIVAFVMAMTFRGFVLEGFVIPTGSMAPTLMGQHTLWTSAETGATFRLDAANLGRYKSDFDISLPDPMLGPKSPPSETISLVEMAKQIRMGDRILVLKSMYPFREPSRWDVVVFKNPTSPKGAKENYIKRLIGLAGEKILLVDGDVFAGPAETGGERLDDLVVQRKPEYIQRAVWQPVYDSDYIPLRRHANSRWADSPWRGQNWTTSGVREFTTDTASRTELTWDQDRLPITDWNVYDLLNYRSDSSITPTPMSDIRVAATIEPENAELETTLELQTRGHIFAFTLKPGEASVTYWPIGRPDEKVAPVTAPFNWNAGSATPVEFWHVDQTMQVFVRGDRILNLEYDWRPVERYENASGGDFEDIGPNDIPNVGRPAELVWRFEGAATVLRRVRLDRDLHYRATALNNNTLPQDREPGFACHPETVGVLGPDHFMMLGDNSPASSDSRVWGDSDPLVITQIDPAPFVVHRKLLLGKAWSVYFPSPYRLANKYRIVPDFGRLRLIR